MTTGETDLGRILANLGVSRRSGDFVFVTVDAGTASPTLLAAAAASVVEDEGLTLVLDANQARSSGLTVDDRWAWLTLNIHTSLAAVGVTAAVSTALADAGIACNMIAGRYHDHLLVPFGRAEAATRVLGTLASGFGDA